MSRRRREKPTVPVGTRVRLPLLWHKMEAEVVEHRGFIGVGGREMVRIQPLDPADDRGAFDIAVEELEIGADPDAPETTYTLGGISRTSPASLHLPVGARVRVQLPNSALDMEVVEDRGVLEGRQVVRVRALDDEFVRADFEVMADDVEVLSVPKPRRGRAAA